MGCKIEEVFFEFCGQKYLRFLCYVIEIGVIYCENELVVDVMGFDGMWCFYFDFEYVLLLNLDGKLDGVIIMVYDVMEKVEVR